MVRYSESARQSATDAFSRRACMISGRDALPRTKRQRVDLTEPRELRMASNLGRRDILALLGAALTSAASPANAQRTGRVRVVGALMGLANDAETQARSKAFEQGLERAGWSIGENLRVEYRYAEGDSARMQAFAKDLVELKPDCIVGHSTPVVTALMQVTRTIPIVFVSVSDPVGSGFVKSMARPGGNVTGFTILHASITPGLQSCTIQILRPPVAPSFCSRLLNLRRNSRSNRRQLRCTIKVKLSVP